LLANLDATRSVLGGRMPVAPATHVCLVLDRSGSMQAVHDDALGGVNSYIASAKRDRALYESKFSLITFNSESVDTIRTNEIMEMVRPITVEEYRCAGFTPLYDAIGRGIVSDGRCGGESPRAEAHRRSRRGRRSPVRRPRSRAGRRDGG
jgi:hypothetical protein